LIHDGSEEVVGAFPESTSGLMKAGTRPIGQRAIYGQDAKAGYETTRDYGNDSGSAARFFYTAKADKGDRLSSKHPTVKPVDLMAYLCRLVCPPGGIVLDPFAGSGSTGMACMRDGFDAILIEREAEYVADIKRRIAHVSGEDAPLFAPQEAFI
jgi:site-specific DNA-methyltransferase (adenine-specific)